MRKIDRATLKRSLGGSYPNGPRQSWTLVNEAEGRVYFLGWNVHYRDYAYPLRNSTTYPPVSADAQKGLVEWQQMLDRVRDGELEACLVLQVPADAKAEEFRLQRILDCVFFGEVVETDGEVWFRVENRVPLRSARSPRQESA
jgi:hypothetical protein